jgi:aspartate-semialdehyde dehydrogenase
MKVAIVGVTGMVGNVMIQILEERGFPVSEFIPVASERSVGKIVKFNGKDHKVISCADGVLAKPDIALFSAGGSTSLTWAPKYAEAGSIVIDNSSAWRMDPSKKLVIPEVNASELTEEDRIIANPNCSTIQLVMALAPIHRKFDIKRLVISTYQSITGTGVQAVRQYEEEASGNVPKEEDTAYPHPIFANCLPHCDIFYENGYTKEELKLVNETRKILSDDSIQITATAVRVPVQGGHSEAVNIELANNVNIGLIKKELENTPGIVVLDDPSNNVYPMPLNAYGKDEVFIGRIRQDHSHPCAFNCWIVSDNLRKGAATNAVQIAEYIVAENLISQPV